MLTDFGLNAWGMQLFLESILSAEQEKKDNREAMTKSGINFSMNVECNSERARYQVKIERKRAIDPRFVELNPYPNHPSSSLDLAHFAIEEALCQETLELGCKAVIHYLGTDLEGHVARAMPREIAHALAMATVGLQLKEYKRGLILAGRALAVYDAFPDCDRCVGTDAEDFCAEGEYCYNGRLGIPHNPGQPPYCTIQQWDEVDDV